MLLDCIREMKEQNFDIGEVLDLMQLWYRDIAHVQGHEGHEPADFQG